MPNLPLVLTIIFICFQLESQAQNDYKFGLSHRLLFNDFGTNVLDADAPFKPQKLPRGMELSFSKRIKDGLRFNVPLRIGFTKGSDDTTRAGLFLILVKLHHRKRCLYCQHLGILMLSKN
jgi:hypothetical protein